MFFFSTIISIVHADTITITSVTDDSYVNEESKSTNYGNDANLVVQSRHTGKNYYSFIEFDLSSIPPGATITSATLNLYAISVPSSSRTYEVQRSNQSWSESTINWNNKPGVLGISVTNTIGTTVGWKVWDVTSDVQTFYGGSNNYGWRIKDSVDDAGGGGETSTFDSSESSNVQNLPYLYITFTPPESCGISVSPSLDFSSMEPGDTSTNQQTTVTNTGNSPTDTLLISGTDWASGPNTMLVGQTKWSTDSNQDYDLMTALTSSSTDMNVDVFPGSPLTVYFKLRIPVGQKSGSYSQTITFTSGC